MWSTRPLISRKKTKGALVVVFVALAEAFLRVPDQQTRDLLIADKVGDADWGAHRAKSPSALVNSATWGLVVTKALVGDEAKKTALTRLINLAIINLAGVPSIVHALFGVGAFVMFFDLGTSILAAGLTLAVMTMPVVIVSTRESLQAVPQAFREACWSLGATRSQTIRKVVIPNSVTGILTGVILEVSRTVGETAPIMFTGAALFLPFVPDNFFERLSSQTMAMSLHLFTVSTQVPNVPEELPFGVALVLIGMVLVLNSVSIAFRMYLRGQKKW